MAGHKREGGYGLMSLSRSVYKCHNHTRDDRVLSASGAAGTENPWHILHEAYGRSQTQRRRAIGVPQTQVMVEESPAATARHTLGIAGARVHRGWERR